MPGIILARMHSAPLAKLVTPRKATAIAIVLCLIAAAAFVGYKQFRAAQDRQATAEVCELVTATNAKSQKSWQEMGLRSPDIAVLGDSYAQGLYLDDPMNAYPYVLAASVDSSVLVDGIGGTGYVNDGPCDGQQFSTRVDDVVAESPETVIVQAGINDAGRDGVQDAAAEVFSELATQLPDARVIVLGPFTPDSGPDVTAAREAIASAAADNGAKFIDPAGWEFPVMDDGVHPTAQGHQLIADKLVPLIRD